MEGDNIEDKLAHHHQGETTFPLVPGKSLGLQGKPSASQLLLEFDPDDIRMNDV